MHAQKTTDKPLPSGCQRNHPRGVKLGFVFSSIAWCCRVPKRLNQNAMTNKAPQQTTGQKQKMTLGQLIKAAHVLAA